MQMYEIYDIRANKMENFYYIFIDWLKNEQNPIETIAMKKSANSRVGAGAMLKIFRPVA